MSRPPASERLASIAAAATEVFGRLGYRGTRTADVAAKAGISTGSLFTYVESKEALFHLVFLYGLDLLPEPPESLPLASPEPGETIALLRHALRELPLPRLRAALYGDEPADVAGELRGIVEDLYDLIERYWPMFAIIERCAAEMPELEALWFDDARHGHYAGLTKYVQRRMSSGRLRPMPDVAVATRVVVESVAWFAWHRRQGRDSALYDDQTARRTVIEFACAALIPESGAEIVPNFPPVITVGNSSNCSPKERPLWTQPSVTTRSVTCGYPTPTATGRCPCSARPSKQGGSRPMNSTSDPGKPWTPASGKN